MTIFDSENGLGFKIFFSLIFARKIVDQNDFMPITTTKSVLNGYNHWMSRGNDCVEPYNLHVDKEVFRQVEDSYFAINPTIIIKLLTNDAWELHQTLPLEGSREAYNPHQAVYLIVVVYIVTSTGGLIVQLRNSVARIRKPKK
jgi:hypothetical protein